MPLSFKFDQKSGIPPSWNPNRLLMGKRLSDKRIGHYAKKGWYSNEFRQARRELMLRKSAKTAKREGNFLRENGRLIFSPV